MQSFRKMLAAFVVAGSAVAALPAMSGCYATGGAYLVEDAPPPAREEVVVARPGYVWIHGRWTHPGRTWVWRGGYYERERADQVYVEQPIICTPAGVVPARRPSIDSSAPVGNDVIVTACVGRGRLMSSSCGRSAASVTHRVCA